MLERLMQRGINLVNRLITDYSSEVRARDETIAKLRTALTGSQEEARAAWDALGRRYDVAVSDVSEPNHVVEMRGRLVGTTFSDCGTVFQVLVSASIDPVDVAQIQDVTLVVSGWRAGT